MAEPELDAESLSVEADQALSDVEGVGAAAVGDEDPSLVGPGARKMRGALAKVTGLRRKRPLSSADLPSFLCKDTT